MTDPRLLTGIGVSSGIAIGPVVVIEWRLPDVPHRVVSDNEVDSEVARLRNTVREVSENLAELRDRTRQRVGPEEAKIFDAQIMILEDEEFLTGVERLIRDNQLTAARAFEFKALEVRALWAQSTSERLRDRIADLSGIQVRVLQRLLGHPIEDMLDAADGRPAILFTRELTPGLTIQFDRKLVAAFASDEGTRTSHAAILARSLGIPCVMGLVDGLTSVTPGEDVIIDGTHGTVLLRPTRQEIRDARAQDRRWRALQRMLERDIGRPAVTLDGTTIVLQGNVDLPEELSPAAEHGAEGVGLLRTEFLVVGRTALPTEEEQVRYFQRVAQRFAGQPVVVRSYDLGGDKFPAFFRAPTEANPFLGWRAIRVCLDQPDLFMTQIRAVLRARLHGDVRLMLPLITQVEEVVQTRAMVAEAARQLAADGIAAAPDVPVGVMIETPAAAMLADELAAISDFLSVGTNDLTQYTLAVDRGNARLADRFTAFHPAVLRLLARICEAGKRAGITTSVCGEIASEPLAAFLLLGLGYRVLSVSPPALPLVRWLVRQIDVGGAERSARAALASRTNAEALAIVREGLGETIDVRLLEAGRLPRGKRHTTFKP